MFKKNKYTKWYFSIVDFAKSNHHHGYTECHHIIPRSLGGSNSKSNIVRLTAKEHRLVHILLPKMVKTKKHTKSMWYALWMIIRAENNYQKRNLSKGTFYQLAKEEIAKATSKLHKNKFISFETKQKMSEKAKKRKLSDETKKKISQSLLGNIRAKGKTPSDKTIQKILNSRKWYKHSAETKLRISLSNKGRAVTITEETKQKISNSLKGRKPTWLIGKIAHNRGIPHSKETIQKLKKPKEKFTCPHCNKSVGGKSNYHRWHGKNCQTTCNIST